MPPFVDLTGYTFARLTVVERVPNRVTCTVNAVMWRCRCECGTIKVIASASLRSGATKSCGCLQREIMRQASGSKSATYTHGHAGSKPSKTYYAWSNMLARCTYPSVDHYDNYGGRGITVCERWKTFDNFLADMGEKPRGSFIDRIDSNGNYEPGNVRWTTMLESTRNRRTIKLTMDLAQEIHGRHEHGESTVSIAQRMGISKSTVQRVINGQLWKDALDGYPVGWVPSPQGEQ